MVLTFFSKAPGCCLWGGAEPNRLEFGAEWLEKRRCSLPRKRVRRLSPIILCFLFCYPILWSGFLWDTVLHFNILNTLASGVFLLKDNSGFRTETCNQLLYSCRWKKPPVPLGLIDKACRSSYSYADARRTLWARQTAGGVGSREGEGNIAIKTQGDNGF